MGLQLFCHHHFYFHAVTGLLTAYLSNLTVGRHARASGTDGQPRAPVAEQLPCTFCYEENLLLIPGGGTGGTTLDHVFIKNLEATAALSAERIFDDPVSIESSDPVSELKPEDSPQLTHPSDHFGVEVEVKF